MAFTQAASAGDRLCASGTAAAITMSGVQITGWPGGHARGLLPRSIRDPVNRHQKDSEICFEATRSVKTRGPTAPGGKKITMNTTITESISADIKDALNGVKQFTEPRIKEMQKAVLSTLDNARVRITDSEEKAVGAFNKAFGWGTELCQKIWDLIKRFFAMLGRGCSKVMGCLKRGRQ
jgi:hypothetical protein